MIMGIEKGVDHALSIDRVCLAVLYMAPSSQAEVHPMGLGELTFRIDHGVVLSHILTSYSAPDSTRRIKSGLRHVGLSQFLRFGMLYPAYQLGTSEEIVAATVLISLEFVKFSATGFCRKETRLRFGEDLRANLRRWVAGRPAASSMIK
jgi:hypothetical protein